ncbi:8975_t:CDS:2 [Entrophospora sp. SA101]|nr:8975_t:CDS:2 [Entrophospora sp. SA101]CAJ0926378.1 16251_t:CDS:2 [Entrophospora sp. SA101]
MDFFEPLLNQAKKLEMHQVEDDFQPKIELFPSDQSPVYETVDILPKPGIVLKTLVKASIEANKYPSDMKFFINISTAFIDYNDKYQLYGAGSGSNASLALCSNDEEVEEQLLKKIRKPNFVWAHFRDLETIDPNEYQNGLKNISNRIDRLYNQIPTNSVLMVIGEPKIKNEHGIAFIRVKN